jgi:hypothetical protein
MKAGQRGGGSERSHHADRNFAVATVALMIFFLVAGFSAWMFGNPDTAAESSAASYSEIRSSTK